MSEVHGEKVKSYSLATSYGALKGRYCGGDLQPYSGIVESGSLSVVLSLREVARNIIPKTDSLSLTANAKVAVKITTALAKAMELIAQRTAIQLQLVQITKFASKE